VAILVTRPHPDNETTAAALRTRGFDTLLAPVLRFEPVAFHVDPAVHYGAVLVSSANALRAIAGNAACAPLKEQPLFAVGDRTAQAARSEGFVNVTAAGGDGAALRELVVAQARAKAIRKSAPLLYLAGADVARDIGGELDAHGFEVVTRTVYRMTPVADLPGTVADAFASGRIDAVLHYSRRSARAFVDAARTTGVEISALALPQCCLSDAVASIVRDAGATQVAVAAAPDEDSLLDALDRALRSRAGSG
jgi:uroporphyrinogen-III synthase